MMVNPKADEIRSVLETASGSIRNVIFARLPSVSGEEAKDIEQEVKLKLWGLISRGKKIDNLRSYLWRVVYTTALDVIEARIPALMGKDVEDEASRIPSHRLEEISPELQLEAAEARRLIRDAVAGLPARRKAVVTLWLEDMNIEEIAATLRWGENQVRHLLYRGIEDVKAAFAGRPKAASDKPPYRRPVPQGEKS